MSGAARHELEQAGLGRPPAGPRAAAWPPGLAAAGPLLVVVSPGLGLVLLGRERPVAQARVPAGGSHGDELLDTAEESLEVVSRLAASLLDLTRLQAGARSVFPRPADLEEIIVHALAGLGSRSRAVRVNLPSGLPAVMADPPLMERVIANLIGNALRYSPDGVPPLLTARARGGRVELRVADRGPGVPPADRDRMFVPFQRLGATEPASGIGLGLAVSRGLTEAMRGTLEPDETPGGGLTMIMSVPAAPPPGLACRHSLAASLT
jgi:two-component system sensor histidine kinase KdpD